MKEVHWRERCDLVATPWGHRTESRDVISTAKRAEAGGGANRARGLWAISVVMVMDCGTVTNPAEHVRNWGRKTRWSPSPTSTAAKTCA